MVGLSEQADVDRRADSFAVCPKIKRDVFS